jgi:microcystin degradation protein MlrC
VDFQDIAERVIVCLATGVNREDPASFAFRNIRPGVRLRPRAASPEVLSP